MLRKELPDLTDDDIDWLCGLTEAAEAWEPVSVMSPGNFITPAVRAQPSKRRRGGNGTTTTRALESPGGAFLRRHRIGKKKAAGYLISPQQTIAKIEFGTICASTSKHREC